MEYRRNIYHNHHFGSEEQRKQFGSRFEQLHLDGYAGFMQCLEYGIRIEQQLRDERRRRQERVQHECDLGFRIERR
jgi:hypothetical protein